ncbi:hypothetical protein [Metabacillus malikii]|uniref:Sensor histidine kinase n=1 Tax=Metabacillus malikii TaxID=1504265 RepID=A0ABT9ZM33_9BACI|nr:hypothetical protein [Metabacillus malikii]MDQ0232578.1 hypothetical protein [Metabacillus malikii]
MKKLRNRLIFHFTLQFITISIAIALIVIVLLFILLNYIAKDEMKRNIAVGTLEGIFNETELYEDKAIIPNNWKEILKPRQMWVQVINNNGDVIGEFNTPRDLPSNYDISDILSIEKNQELEGYTVLSRLDNTYEELYYFILGESIS